MSRELSCKLYWATFFFRCTGRRAPGLSTTDSTSVKIPHGSSWCGAVACAGAPAAANYERCLLIKNIPRFWWAAIRGLGGLGLWGVEMMMAAQRRILVLARVEGKWEAGPVRALPPSVDTALPFFYFFLNLWSKQTKEKRKRWRMSLSRLEWQQWYL